MIFVDSSAIVAMLAREPEEAAFIAALQREPETVTSGHVMLESAMRLSSMFNVLPSAADQRVTRLLQETATAVVPITEDIAHIAVEAFERYGKGRAKPGLNFGDCLSYACAKAHGARLLYKGEDFAATDIARA